MVVADRHDEGRLAQQQGGSVRDLPAALLPYTTQPHCLVQNRIIWIRDDTFLLLQSRRAVGETNDIKEPISLARYRYVFHRGKPELVKEADYKWPFASYLTFRDEIGSEFRVSPDKQSLLVPLGPRWEYAWSRKRFVGLIRLNPKAGQKASALWPMNKPSGAGLSYRNFWLPDSKHFVTVFEDIAMDYYDASGKTPPVRIVEDPERGDHRRPQAASYLLRGKEPVGVDAEGYLVLLETQEQWNGKAGRYQLNFTLLPIEFNVPKVISYRGWDALSDTSQSNIESPMLSPNGKQLLFRGYFPAPRANQSGFHEMRWQGLTFRNFTQQFATLDLQTGKTTPLFQSSAENVTINRIGIVNGINFGPQWLPSGRGISVSAENPGWAENNRMWRIPTTR